MTKKILLLGAGELGKEFVIAAQRLGQHIIAVDRYAGAPGMQIAHDFEVIDLMDAEELDKVVKRHRPDIIVSDMESICTERLAEYEKQGIQIAPSAKAVALTTNRRAIRDLVSNELGLKTAKYAIASNTKELQMAILRIGLPCVVKPLISSSGKGLSVVKTERDIPLAWVAACKENGENTTVLVEQLIHFQSELTLLTVTQKDGPTLFCPPIGHREERGDYQESWQPAPVAPALLKEAQQIAELITAKLGGAGLWGVEFFLTETEIYFSEISPRPHDTGLVTLAGTQTFNEFELHLRAVLGLPIPSIEAVRAAASAVILAEKNIENPSYPGIEKALKTPCTDVRIFGKPSAHNFRRMGVALAWDDAEGADIKKLRETAVEVAGKIKVK